MTQTTQKPTVLTYDKLHAKFEEKFPQLIAPLEQAKDKLERGEGAQDLANIISCQVDMREESTSFVYTWTGQAGQAFEYPVLKPFNPTPERKPQEAPEAHEEQQAQQEAANPPEAAETDAGATDEAQEPSEPTPEPDEAPKIAEAAPNATPSSPGIFSALAELIGQSTLLMTIAKVDDDMTVNVMPFGDDKDSSVSALCLTATPAELDVGFVEAVSVKVEGRKNLAAQIEELKAAEKELETAKKAEADAKKAETAKKNKVAEAKKKEEDKKKAAEAEQAKKDAEQAENAGTQEAIF